MEGVRILVRVSDGRASVLIRRVDKEKCTVANDEVEGAFPLRRRVFNSVREASPSTFASAPRRQSKLFDPDEVLD